VLSGAVWVFSVVGGEVATAVCAIAACTVNVRAESAEATNMPGVFILSPIMSLD
jgi:hypothetical protein